MFLCAFTFVMRVDYSERGEELGLSGGGSGAGNCDGEACKVAGMYLMRLLGTD